MTSRLLFIALIAGGLLAGCSLQSVTPDKTFYQFGCERPATLQRQSPLHDSVRLADFRTSQLNRTASLIYRETDQRYAADPYRLLTAGPGTLLAERSRQWLVASGLFRDVVPATSGLETGLQMEGELIDLHVDVRDPKHPAAVLALRARLIDADGHAKKYWQFNQHIALDNAAAATAVAGLDRALCMALADLEQTLARQ